MDMATAAPKASTLRHHMFPHTLPRSLGRRTLRPSRDSEGMAPTEGHPFKVIVIIILVSRAVARPLEEPLPPVGCPQAVVALLVVALLVMEVLRPILTPLINPHMAVEAILVGMVAAVEGMVDRQIMGMEATVVRQAVAVMVAQEDRVAMAATGAMETRMADRPVAGMVVVTVEEVTTTLQGAEDEDSRVTYCRLYLCFFFRYFVIYLTSSNVWFSLITRAQINKICEPATLEPSDYLA